MAIVFFFFYYKIIDYKVNFENKSTLVGLKIYDSSISRNKEKILVNAVSNFKNKMQNYISNIYSNLIKEIENAEQAYREKDSTDFLVMYPQIKDQINKFEEIKSEGKLLNNKVLEEDIDKGALSYLKEWQKLGLTDEMCKKIGCRGQTYISLDGTNYNTLKELYTALKVKIPSFCIDC